MTTFTNNRDLITLTSGDNKQVGIVMSELALKQGVEGMP